MNIDLKQSSKDVHTATFVCPRCGWFVVVNVADSGKVNICPVCKKEQSDD